MRNTILRIVYGVLLFAAAFVLMVCFSEDTGTQTTTELQDPVLPVVSMDTGSTVFNALHGIVTEQDAGKMRPVLTPLSSERGISLQVNTYGETILSASVEARDISGERLIEAKEVELADAGDGIFTATVSFQNLLESDTEYLMVILLSTEEMEEIRYYTRIVYSEEDTAQEEVQEALDFSASFHEATFGAEEYSEMLGYLEPESDGNTDSYQTVTINSSTDLVTWGDLEPVCVTEPVYSIVDIQGNTYGIRGAYYIEVETSEEDGTEALLYRVEEYYELERGTERFWLMDYQRTMSQDFDPSNPQGEDNALELGIADENLPVMQDESGDTTAFVHDGRLFAVQASGKIMIYIYGFDSAGDTGERETFAEHDIRILNVDEDGSVDFLVYGYMNSGLHEGEIGSAFYHYSGEHHTLEEMVYIPYDGSWEMLNASVGRVCYYNAEEECLYLILNDSLYEINVETRSVRTAAENLSGRQTVVSDSGQLIAYEETENAVSTGRIILLDLNGLKQTIVEAGSGEHAVPLGFLGEDLIYGIAGKADALQDDAGFSVELMAHIMIVDQELNVLEDYSRDGVYVTSVEVGDNQVILSRVRRTVSEDGSILYEPAEDDEIVSSVEEEQDTLTQTTATDRYGTTVQILAGDADIGSLRYIRPQEITYEGSRELSVRTADTGYEADSAVDEHFYAYNCAGLVDHVYRLREAIERAAESSTGVVIGADGQYLWRSSMEERAEIDELTEMEEGSALRSGMEVCLETILSYEGVTADVDALLAQGLTAIEILKQELEGAGVYDLTGCSMEEVLYYVSEELPVYAMTGTETAVLLIGYGPENVELFDPEAGSVYLLERGDAEALFESAGNRFICYLPG